MTPPQALRRAAQRRAPGSALLLVLWVIALLSFLIVTTLMISMQDVEALSSRQVISKAHQLAESGMAIACHVQIERGDPLLRKKVSAAESYEACVTSEESRLNINTLLTDDHRAVLERHFKNWGLAPLEAESLVDVLMDCVDTDEFKRLKGAETADYKNQGVSYHPLNRPFRTLGELSEVPGMQQIRRMAPHWQEAFTVWGDGRLDLNEATPEGIAAAMDVPLMTAKNFTRHRDGPDGTPHTRDDMLADEMEVAIAD